VNAWLGWPRPRPDWISKNEPADNGIFQRGDLDPIAYGGGIIFIYFLRYQLGYSYDQICSMAGGPLLSDRYRGLTGATDDPAARVSALLDKHFGTGAINLVGNNPFPLYEGADRKVILAFSKASAISFLLPLERGHAHVKPFFNCPPADYPYSEQGSNVTQTITATALGIGFPAFSWRVNGKLLPGGSQLGAVSAAVDVPDPQNPDRPSHQTRTFTFDYTISRSFTASGGSSSLTITSRGLDGTYQFGIEADGDETAAPQGAVTASASLSMKTRAVVYGGGYQTDRDNCAHSFEKNVVGRVRVVQDVLSRVHNLPDPSPGYLTAVIEAFETIREELARIAESDHASATKIAEYVAVKIGVPAHLFVKGARGTSATTV
jgi:hypothetical protein